MSLLNRLAALMFKPQIFIIGLIAVLTVTPVVSAEPEENEILISEIETAFQAKENGDFARAASHFGQAAAVLAKDARYQTVIGQIELSNVLMEQAEVLHRGSLSGGCKPLTVSQAAFQRAKQLDNSVEPEFNDQIQRAILSRLTGLEVKLGCDAFSDAGGSMAKADPKLVGHYFLSGVQETGSELLLRADGTFDWFMSYGAVDQFAKGRWARNGSAVRLLADRPTADAEVFKLDTQFPWDGAAELSLLEASWSKQKAAIEARCPILDMLNFISPVYLQAPSVSRDPIVLQRAAMASKQTEAARFELERSAAKAIAGHNDPELMKMVTVALASWQDALSNERQKHVESGLPAPQYKPPTLPAQCNVPSYPTKIPPVSQWQRGIAAIVGDTDKRMRLSGVTVKFQFADGHTETEVTGSNGWAMIQLRTGQAVVALELSMTEPTVPSMQLSIKPMMHGFQTINVNSDMITGPPFNHMLLKVDGADLIPDEWGRGRYSRQ